MNYTLTQAEYSRLKTKLTRAINSKDNARIIRTVDEAESIFEEKGYPDLWYRWIRAREDARISERFSGSKW